MNFIKQSALPKEGLSIESLMELLFYREEFLTIASHELKTPLTALKLHAQVFKRNSIKNPVTHYEKKQVDALVEQMESQANRMGKLVDAMIDISRIRSSQMHYLKEPFNLSETVNSVLKNQFIEHPLQQFSVKLKENITFVGDKKRIEQVLSNVLDNAVKYGKKLPIEVKLTQRKETIFFSVTDLGYGISEEDKKRIFNYFQRAIPASEVSGIGLGLFIAQEIVQAHGGEIRVKSDIGKGSTFKVVLKKGNSP